ncbi:PspC domain-containing protein [Filimonas effusa]|uniref:PspC domain-containing protein n=1 Tax=Filimonas effusa TaxID=2508721 RepID=A0A4Q1D5T7_9BACT|nr:PspC domain-containing protein [Filimonas effusa]RXK83865.1 PspC domain-containing protein [Filimonas effusa]
MRKIININFQGRVIPIEETAYDILKQYIESLRRFFANEEGRDEIINDIEGRIAELFGETLSKGAPCITDEKVHDVINSIGRPEDFDDQENHVKEQLKDEGARHKQHDTNASQSGTRRLYRDGDDKILGGVCAGIANYFRIDPAIIRLLFAVVTLGGLGSGLLLYILLWAVIPVKKLDQSIIRKRLFRNPEDKVVAGVASGVAAYFDVAVWVPRLIFAFPLLITVVASIWRNLFWDHFFVPTSIVFSSFGGTFFLVYAILWMMIPEASSASEKLEMKGEKVDLNSIKNTIQEDLGAFRQKAEKWGEEFKTRAEEWSNEFGTTFQQKGKQFSQEVSYAGKNTGGRIAHAIGVLIKAFFLIIAGIISFSLLMGLIGLLAGGVGFAPLANFFLDGIWQKSLAIATVILFVAVPVIFLLIWFVRRMVGIRSSRKSYLGIIAGGLWTLGWICAFILGTLMLRNFRSRNGVAEQLSISQPSTGKLIVTAKVNNTNVYGSDWFDSDRSSGFPFISRDSFFLDNIRIWVVKSQDSLFHLETVKFSRGSSQEYAKQVAEKISFSPLGQQDSVLTLPDGITITSKEQFRNQQVLVKIAVPQGKRIFLDASIDHYDWFSLRKNGDWEEHYEPRVGIEYIMTEKGLRTIKEAWDEAHPSDREKEKESLKELKRREREFIDDQKEKERALRDSIRELEKRTRKIGATFNVQQRKAAAQLSRNMVTFLPNPSGLLWMRFGF